MPLFIYHFLGGEVEVFEWLLLCYYCCCFLSEVSYLVVLGAQSTTEDYIRAENKPQSIS